MRRGSPAWTRTPVEPRGRLRADARAVRFVEVVVNGPKSWSLAAELHPDVAAAYEAAQDRAAGQIIGWLGAARHHPGRAARRRRSPSRSSALEAVTVRHYTSRAGDPHRHLHLQVNARVFAAGKWRGLDTVAFRDSIAAINGIGHAAVACDPEFRAALAAHGYTLNEDGRDRAARAVRRRRSPNAPRRSPALLDRYEAHWRTEHPGAEPGPGLRRAWDARAWAEDRPDKVVPRSGDELRQRWLAELAALGYRDRDKPIQLALPTGRRAGPGRRGRRSRHPVGCCAVGVERRRRARPGRTAARPHRHRRRRRRCGSSWPKTSPPARLTLCVPLREQPTPEAHPRAHLPARARRRGRPRRPARRPRRDRGGRPGRRPRRVDGLDAGQRAAVAALAGDAPLVVIEGAAGAGKTTTARRDP